jgi:hypothetical protein
MMKCTGRPYLALELLALCGLVTALPSGAFAAKIIVCSTCDPLPIPITPTDDTLDQVQASSTVDGNLTLTFVNLTGVIMDDLVFGTTINEGLSAAQLSADNDFTCAVDVGLFLNCAVAYDPNTGALNYYYYGVNPPSILDTPGFVIIEDIIGQGFGDTGIPNLGVFSVELAGWTSDLSDPNIGELYSGPNGFPDFTQNAYNTSLTPPAGSVYLYEPPAPLILLTELLLLAGALALFRRRLKWSKRFGF